MYAFFLQTFFFFILWYAYKLSLLRKGGLNYFTSITPYICCGCTFVNVYQYCLIAVFYVTIVVVRSYVSSNLLHAGKVNKNRGDYHVMCYVILFTLILSFKNITFIHFSECECTSTTMNSLRVQLLRMMTAAL